MISYLIVLGINMITLCDCATKALTDFSGALITPEENKSVYYTFN